MSIERVALVVHTGKPDATNVKNELFRFFDERGISVDEESPDLVVALGGDGTTLRAAQLAHEADALLLGVNVGTLGYLTEVDAGHAIAALEQILNGSFALEERMMLSCTAPGDVSYVGMNEVLVERSSRYRLVRLTVRVGGGLLGTFNGDGVIVATPTGSTAYALSAGGPIVDPAAECLVVVPVSPHMLFSRPFVLSPDETVEITVDQPEIEASLSLDGAIGGDLSAGATVVVRRHPRPLRLVRLSGPGFLERLRVKLRLPG